jgi:NTP pyrophosphatase (non-canonical NTP hydrolase)
LKELFMADEQPLTFAAYQEAAATSDRGPEGSLVIPLLGLFGETGGLLSVVKKKKRDRETDIGYRPAVIEELGDVLWYLTTVARHAGIALSDIASNANRGLSASRGIQKHVHSGSGLRQTRAAKV